MGTLAVLGALCGCKPSPVPTTDVSTTSTEPEAPTVAVDCDAWRGHPTVPEVTDELPPIATGYVDLTYFSELADELEANVPGLAQCGLDVRALDSLRVVLSRSGAVEGQITGLPPLDTLRDCPLIPDLVAEVEGRGWTVEDGADASIRVRPATAPPLAPAAFEFRSPPHQWFLLHGTAGPTDRRVTVTVSADNTDEADFRIHAPESTIDGANAWCERVIDKQRALGLRWIAQCIRPDPQTLVFVPDEVDAEATTQLFSGIRTEFFETFHIHGESMLPNLRDGDVVFVDKTIPGVPPRGTVVIVTHEDTSLIKRIVGLPGDRLEFGPEGIRINGALVPTSKSDRSDAVVQCELELRQWTLDGNRFEYFDDPTAAPFTVDVPAGHVYLLGDNRSVSMDSRTIGPVPVERIVGRGSYIAWSKVGEMIDWERTTSTIR